MLAEISTAHKSIFLEMYILDDDAKGSEFFEVLEAAARRGVKVVLILDVVGSYNPISNAVGRLREAGAEVLFASFFFQRMHRKILIIDETFAFVGGVNVGKKYARWKDLQVRVVGPHVIESILRSFARVYRKCGGKGELPQVKPHTGVFRSAKLWFIDHGIGRRNELLRTYYQKRLDMATKSIVFVTPYLLPPRWFIAHLHQALIRGVHVEILLPLATDYRIVNTINRSYASFLANLGAKIYYIRGMNHAKAMLVDMQEGIIGSQNLDFLSFHMNIEAGVFFHEPDMVNDLSKVIEGWKSESVSDASQSAKFRWYDIPMAFFLRLFGFIPLG